MITVYVFLKPFYKDIWVTVHMDKMSNIMKIRIGNLVNAIL